jgi:hypothetical protein
MGAWSNIALQVVEQLYEQDDVSTPVINMEAWANIALQVVGQLYELADVSTSSVSRLSRR